MQKKNKKKHINNNTQEQTSAQLARCVLFNQSNQATMNNSQVAKPQLISEIKGHHSGPISDAIFAPEDGAVITGSEDK